MLILWPWQNSNTVHLKCGKSHEVNILQTEKSSHIIPIQYLSQNLPDKRRQTKKQNNQNLNCTGKLQKHGKLKTTTIHQVWWEKTNSASLFESHRYYVFSQLWNQNPVIQIPCSSTFTSEESKGRFWIKNSALKKYIDQVSFIVTIYLGRLIKLCFLLNCTN